MGVALKDLIKKQEIELKDLKDKVIAIDTFNMLYQFLTTIRAPDGSTFTDSKGHVTSHLIGLFSRTVRFIEAGIKPVFVFDGTAPKLKEKERELFYFTLNMKPFNIETFDVGTIAGSRALKSRIESLGFVLTNKEKGLWRKHFADFREE